jgi:hypothetical protein
VRVIFSRNAFSYTARLQLAHLSGFVLDGGRDARIAVNHCQIVRQKSASKKPNSINGAAAAMQKSSFAGQLVAGRPCAATAASAASVGPNCVDRAASFAGRPFSALASVGWAERSDAHRLVREPE